MTVKALLKTYFLAVPRIELEIFSYEENVITISPYCQKLNYFQGRFEPLSLNNKFSVIKLLHHRSLTIFYLLLLFLVTYFYYFLVVSL